MFWKGAAATKSGSQSPLRSPGARELHPSALPLLPSAGGSTSGRWQPQGPQKPPVTAVEDVGLRVLALQVADVDVGRAVLCCSRSARGEPQGHGAEIGIPELVPDDPLARPDRRRPVEVPEGRRSLEGTGSRPSPSDRHASPPACRRRTRWTSRIAPRRRRSGRSIVIWRSKRPGRLSAGSSMSARLVGDHHDPGPVSEANRLHRRDRRDPRRRRPR